MKCGRDQYSRLENLKSFDEFLERRFPESAYYLMLIHEHLPPQLGKELKEIGWTKGRELTKLARRDGQHFHCAPWVHKGCTLPKEDFRREVEKELTEKEEEPSELIFFKVYKSQIPVIEQANNRDRASDARLRQSATHRPGIPVLLVRIVIAAVFAGGARWELKTAQLGSVIVRTGKIASKPDATSDGAGDQFTYKAAGVVEGSASNLSWISSETDEKMQG